MRTPLSSLALALPLAFGGAATLSGCEATSQVLEQTPEDLQDALDESEAAETSAATIVAALEPLELQGTLTPEQAVELRWARRDIARERAHQAELRALQQRRGRAQEDAVRDVQTGVGQAISGNWVGALLAALSAIAGAVGLIRKEAAKIRAEAEEQREADRRQREAELEAVRERVDTTLIVQGLAPTTARSAEAARSPGARAAASTAERDVELAIDRILARRSGVSPTPTPTPPAPPAAPPPAARPPADPGLEAAIEALQKAIASTEGRAN